MFLIFTLDCYRYSKQFCGIPLINFQTLKSRGRLKSDHFNIFRPRSRLWNYKKQHKYTKVYNQPTLVAVLVYMT